MARFNPLPLPVLSFSREESVPFITDDALASSVGVYMGFSSRAGGVSEAPFDTLNLGSMVHDNSAAVAQNRARVLAALNSEDAALVVPLQVHGTDIVEIPRQEDVAAAQKRAEEGADALLVQAPNVCALLCFADCVPVIVVSPTGHFAVVHAGWRGAVAGIVGKAVRALARADAPLLECSEVQCCAQFNMYIGPCIHAECFEVSREVSAQFEQRFGASCLADERHVDLPCAVSLDARAAGMVPERIADCGVCTMCNHEQFFSYRASNGTCGRHGAFALRKEA